MTDKRIIIDEVDVSGCEWFGQIDLDINVICTSNSPKKCSTYCKDIPNCYYKQLKRKEQECERLKIIKEDFFKQAEISHQAVLNKNKIIEKLEKEESKYKQTIAKIKDICSEMNCESLMQNSWCVIQILRRVVGKKYLRDKFYK